MIINSPLRKRQTVTNASEHLSTDFVLKIQSLQQLVAQEVVITNHQDIINMEKHQTSVVRRFQKARVELQHFHLEVIRKVLGQRLKPQQTSISALVRLSLKRIPAFHLLQVHK